ncbi:type II and III secretion system protein family protein [Trinickia terrae]|uniref:Type II and III secretion system protein family protein n=1 Tax=Trinickia terrae TaxID=2571161 RepID=A0A4U1HZD1_9BURK|nr:type II and III secretion system protein family protein [Trinickia terrae]TKC86258.1 type II and III secretion system protein family protein [Trinickia terrae]
MPRMLRSIARSRWLWPLAAALAFTLAHAGAARADSDGGAVLTVYDGGGEVLTLPEPAVAVFVANPDVADIQVPTPRTVFVLGKKAGTTTLLALGANNRTILRKTVVVATDVRSLQRLLDTRFPQLHLTVSGAPGSLMVAGDVPSATEADSALETLKPYLHEKETIVNKMTIAHPIQVNLRVRVTEVNRNITQQLGINWNVLGNFGSHFFSSVLFPPSLTSFCVSNGCASSLSNGVTLDTVLQALDQDGLVTMLAEPNLTAMSGETASFLAGGEIPIPVAQSGSGGSIASTSVTVEFKPFGVSLDFTPTVLADNRISLKVRPEVSQLDQADAVTLSGFKIPALTVRRVETTVELASGQSFAIGGLLQSTDSDVIAQVPGLGRLPVIGKLFSSKNFQDNKTELVVIVTPYLVQPTSPSRTRQAIETITKPSGDLEFSLQHEFGLDPLAGDTPRLTGNAGFVY